MNSHSRFIGLLRGLGPALPPPVARDLGRSALGAAIGLALADLWAFTPLRDMAFGFVMLGPFGATAVLVFAAPNSPLAQPWSAIVGNTLSALVGVSVALLVSPGPLAFALAGGLAIAAMTACRALHPPGGAVAVTALLSPEAIAKLGYGFALVPVASGTATLVVAAVVWARLTGRHYPFRTVPQTGMQAGAQPLPDTGGLQLTATELTDLLRDYRQGANLGAADLARLIAEAERRAAAHRLDALACAEVMTRDLVTVRPWASAYRLAALFDRHRYSSMPVVARNGRFLGLVEQIDLITAGRRLAPRRFGFGWTGRGGQPRPTAASIMAADALTVSPEAPLGDALRLLAQSGRDAIAVVKDARLVGILTRTDLITALAAELAHRSPQGLPPDPHAPR